MSYETFQVVLKTNLPISPSAVAQEEEDVIKRVHLDKYRVPERRSQLEIWIKKILSELEYENISQAKLVRDQRSFQECQKYFKTNR